MKIIASRLWNNPKVIMSILLNIPSLDPTIVLSNPSLYLIKENDKIASFLALKKHKNFYELKSLYTFPEFRKKDYARNLIKSIKSRPMVLQCNIKLENFYSKSGFKRIPENKYRFLGIKTKLFNVILRPLLRYKLIMMESR